MGSWQLESVKMFLYVMFPVTVFHIFNQPDIFKEWVTEVRARHYPQAPEEQIEEFRKARLAQNKKRLENSGALGT